MNLKIILAGGLLSLLCLGVCRAEKVDLSPSELRKTATHVITGKVASIYTRQTKDAKWQTTHYVAEVRVAAVEKGDGLAKDQLVYIRYWDRRWISPDPPEPNTSGHRGLPAMRDTMRIYLARNAYDGFTFENKDGGYNVIGANGFEDLK